MEVYAYGTIMDEILYSDDVRHACLIHRLLFAAPTMPLFIKELGGNESQVGLAAGAFTLTAVIFRPVVGGLLDRYGRRPFMVWGLVFFVLSMYLYNWIGGIALLLALRVLHGASWAFSTTAVSTSVTDIIPIARRGKVWDGSAWR